VTVAGPNLQGTRTTQTDPRGFFQLLEDANDNPINLKPTYGQVRGYQPPTQTRLGWKLRPKPAETPGRACPLQNRQS